MVAQPVDDRWSVRTIAADDTAEALKFLRREPLLNVYLISKLLDEGLMMNGDTVEIRCSGAIVCVASLTSNLVLAVAPDLDPQRRTYALRLVADRILRSITVPRAIISDASVVDEFWRLVHLRLDPPTVIRLNQPVYALTSGRDLPTALKVVRYSRLDDLDELVPACAAMHREEVGIDPLQRDAAGYRQRIRELVLQRRSLIMKVRGHIAFKTEFSAVTPEAVQLMGVWTRPDERRHGLAREGLAEICGHILSQNRAVTLFVNDFNSPAIRLYQSLGFRPIGNNRAMIW